MSHHSQHGQEEGVDKKDNHHTHPVALAARLLGRRSSVVGRLSLVGGRGMAAAVGVAARAGARRRGIASERRGTRTALLVRRPGCFVGYAGRVAQWNLSLGEEAQVGSLRLDLLHSGRPIEGTAACRRAQDLSGQDLVHGKRRGEMDRVQDESDDKRKKVNESETNVSGGEPPPPPPLTKTPAQLSFSVLCQRAQVHPVYLRATWDPDEACPSRHAPGLLNPPTAAHT